MLNETRIADVSPPFGGSWPGELATIVYRSRAVAPLSGPELQRLMHTARSRNQVEDITGVVVYDDSWFFQWLEGPPPAVERVMHSIRKDVRHTDVEILAHASAPARAFQGWSMKLAARRADAALLRDDLVVPPPEVITALRQQPSAAPRLLVKLVPVPLHADASPLATSLADAALSRSTAAILRRVLLDTVIPSLLPGAQRLPQVDAQAAELAELLIAADESGARDLVHELRGRYGEATLLYAPVFEPAARILGDYWDEDRVSEFDVTLGLCRLQSAVRLLGAEDIRLMPRSAPPSVLIAPVPGELHHLAAGLDSEWLWHAGWAPREEFPDDDRALADILSAEWVDMLDLSLSPAFHRRSSLPAMARTIALARRASRNPALAIMVGGRAFVEDSAAGLEIGADMASPGASHIDRLMLACLRQTAP